MAAMMQRRRPLLPFDYQSPQGLDIEPQAAQSMMQPMQPLQFAPVQPEDGGDMSQLAQMGTQRMLAQLLNPKKKTASAKDALAAFEAGGSL